MRLFLVIMLLSIVAGKVYALPANFFVDSVKQSSRAADVEPDGNDIRNQLVRAVIYPEAAHRSKIEGAVVLTVLIDFDGTIKKTKILNSSNELFTQAVEIATNKVKTNPAMQGGKPIQYWMTVPIKFELNNSRTNSLLFKKVGHDKEFTDFLGIQLSTKLGGLYRNRSSEMISGTVTVSITLENDGEIDDVEVLSSTSDYLEEVIPDMLEDLKLIDGIFPDNKDVRNLKITLNVTIAKED